MFFQTDFVRAHHGNYLKFADPVIHKYRFAFSIPDVRINYAHTVPHSRHPILLSSKISHAVEGQFIPWLGRVRIQVQGPLELGVSLDSARFGMAIPKSQIRLSILMPNWFRSSYQMHVHDASEAGIDLENNAELFHTQPSDLNLTYQAMSDGRSSVQIVQNGGIKFLSAWTPWLRKIFTILSKASPKLSNKTNKTDAWIDSLNKQVSNEEQSGSSNWHLVFHKKMLRSWWNATNIQHQSLVSIANRFFEMPWTIDGTLVEQFSHSGLKTKQRLRWDHHPNQDSSFAWNMDHTVEDQGKYAGFITHAIEQTATNILNVVTNNDTKTEDQARRAIFKRLSRAIAPWIQRLRTVGIESQYKKTGQALVWKQARLSCRGICRDVEINTQGQYQNALLRVHVDIPQPQNVGSLLCALGADAVGVFGGQTTGVSSILEGIKHAERNLLPILALFHEKTGLKKDETLSFNIAHDFGTHTTTLNQHNLGSFLLNLAMKSIL